MKSHGRFPEFDDVCSDIGDKVVNAMFKSVEDARRDLATYRHALPHFVADHSERGLANWLHDRMWASVAIELSDVPDVGIIDNGVLREITCGINYRFRAKRHDADAEVRSYPTQMALDFHVQSITFSGLEELKLDFGYEWDPDLRDVGPAVMSLRTGDKLIWSNVIPGSAQTTTISLGTGGTPSSGPGITIEVASKKDSEAQSQ